MSLVLSDAYALLRVQVSSAVERRAIACGRRAETIRSSLHLPEGVVIAAVLADVAQHPSVTESGYPQLDSAALARESGFDALTVSLIAHRGAMFTELHLHGCEHLIYRYAAPDPVALDALNCVYLETDNDGSRVSVSHGLTEAMSHARDEYHYGALSRERDELIGAAARTHRRVEQSGT